VQRLDFAPSSQRQAIEGTQKTALLAQRARIIPIAQRSQPGEDFGCGHFIGTAPPIQDPHPGATVFRSHGPRA
jgi:hypothetical protein